MNEEVAELKQMVGSIPASDEDSLLTPQDVATMLKVPVSWVYGCCRNRAKYSLPYIKVGHYLRFEEKDVRDFIAGPRRHFWQYKSFHTYKLNFTPRGLGERKRKERPDGLINTQRFRATDRHCSAWSGSHD